MGNTKARRGSEASIANSRQTHLHRLAIALNICPIDLCNQFHRFEPMAHKVKQRMNCSNLEAWREALMARRTTPALRAKYPSGLLLQALARYACWKSVSSEVERGFAQSSGLKHGNSEDIFIDKEEALMILRCDRLEGDVLQKLCSEAMKMWLRVYSKPSQPPKSKRIHAELPHPKKRREGEASYLRDRDTIVSGLGGKLGTILPKTTTTVEIHELSDKAVKEIEFNLKKEETAQVEAMLSGFLAASDASPVLLAAAVKHMDTVTRKQHELNLGKARKAKALRKVGCDIRGAAVFFEAGCKTYTTMQLQSRGVTQKMNRWEADLLGPRVSVPEGAVHRKGNRLSHRDD